LDKVTYAAGSTPTVTAISPPYGSGSGGDTITITGTGFSTTDADNTVFFDNIPCVVQAGSTATTLTCETGARPYVAGLAPISVVNVKGSGDAATNALLFRYVSKWSETATWGNDNLPVAGDAVSIPKGRHLLVDVASTPILNTIIVEGSLIFPSDDSDETTVRTFDARLILVQGGYVEMGTEAKPYLS